MDKYDIIKEKSALYMENAIEQARIMTKMNNRNDTMFQTPISNYRSNQYPG